MTAGLPDLAVTPSTLALALVLGPGPRYREAPRGRREGTPWRPPLLTPQFTLRWGRPWRA